VELLSPAGNLQALVAAVNSGADSIYLGLKEFSARAFASNFSIEQIPSIYSYLKSNGIKLYIAINTLIKEIELNKLIKYLSILSKIGVDAIIVQDFGIVNIVNDLFPTLKLHSSTQMTNLNSYDIKFLEKLNFKRVILDRQLFFEEIKLIKNNSSIEIEIFIHGALCYSFAGQCYFSSFLGSQSANRGRCTQPCRRAYILNRQKKGYFFSPNDLSSINNFEQLLHLGIDSFKIEGRMKNEQYVSNVTRAYRILIDYYKKNGKLSENIKKEAKNFIRNSLGRKTTPGIYFNSKSIVEPNLSGATGLFLGKTIESSNRFIVFKTGSNLKIGDRVRIQDLQKTVKINKIIVKNRISNSAKKGEIVKIPLSERITIRKNSLIFKVSSKIDIDIPPSLNRVKNINVKDFDLPQIKEINKHNKEYYFKISNIKDILSFPDNTKDYLILPVNQANELYLVKKKIEKLKNNIIFELPLFIFEKELEKFHKIIEDLTTYGFFKFFINSKSHLQFFKNINKTFLILSERLHIANSYSADLFLKEKVNRVVLDFENDKENLLNFKLKNSAIITLYSNFPLLISRIDNGLKSNSEVMDNKKESFIIRRKKGLVQIFHKQPFNIVENKNELENMGFSKFLFDISNFRYYKKSLKEFCIKLKAGKVQTGKDFNYSYGWQ